MKMRKLLALAMALTLATAPMTVHAAGELTAPGNSGDITTDAGVNYVNTTVYKVTLPTSSGLAFALDPQGLSTLSGTTVTEGSEGQIITTTPWTITNESSVEVTITGEFYLTDTDTDNPLTLLAADKKDSINDAAKQICMIIQERSGSGSPYNFTDLGAVTSASADSKSKVTFNMEAAEYEFGGTSGAYTYTLKGGTGTTKTLCIGGAVASEYDWSAYKAASDAKKLTLNAVFSFDKKAADTYVMAKQSDGSLTYTFIETAPTEAVTAVSINGVSKPGQVSGGYFTIADNVFTIASQAATANFATAGTYTIVVTFGTTDKTFTYTVS